MLIAVHKRLITNFSLPRCTQQISTNKLQNEVQQTQLHKREAAPTAVAKVLAARHHLINGGTLLPPLPFFLLLLLLHPIWIKSIAKPYENTV